MLAYVGCYYAHVLPVWKQNIPFRENLSYWVDFGSFPVLAEDISYRSLFLCLNLPHPQSEALLTAHPNSSCTYWEINLCPQIAPLTLSQ